MPFHHYLCYFFMHCPTGLVCNSGAVKTHWSMYTSLCRYLRVLPVRHTSIFWNKMAATHLLTAEVVVFSFLLLLILHRKTCRMPKGL